ncbi:MAG: 50S ribosomal protein L15e [Candidatus Diapherotrites archaeon]|nr:50S ribosomal protein L15e [Candidatus Diapherotrites archaeon]
MGAYKYIQDTFERESKEKSPEYKQRLMQFRREPAIIRIEKPTNLKRARELGYKAKQGFVVVRVRVKKGSGIHKRPKKGRRPTRMGVRKLTRAKSKQVIAEERAARKYPNCEVLNSYWICEDGTYKWYEVILADINHPSIRNDPDVAWITINKHRGRAFRGKTSAGRKSRGLTNKGKGSEKVRPSIKSNKRKGK